MTNFDKIKENLTVEQLAKIIAAPSDICTLIEESQICRKCPLYNNCSNQSVIKKWLKSEADKKESIIEELSSAGMIITDEDGNGVDVITKKEAIEIVKRGLFDGQVY